MINKFRDVSIKEFREAGMLCIVNMVLSAFGFAILTDEDDKQLIIGQVNPLNSEPKYVEGGLQKVAKYLNENLSDIYGDGKPDVKTHT
jgi:hypothetical protein